ncbi:hypothetical protein GALMADRAFT_161219 [Galerina marginata CBS 339.88]|uniref:Uncharacterized protein n=1 Tax=Galerina marginata (strain CBS 339.88) TaxID=685588 RepID=A0A067SKA3_GALM3|nr:hypothetical protein GALMADRAFT_161219 [Galerina marginata CBS 339.88]
MLSGIWILSARMCIRVAGRTSEGLAFPIPRGHRPTQLNMRTVFLLMIMMCMSYIPWIGTRHLEHCILINVLDTAQFPGPSAHARPFLRQVLGSSYFRFRRQSSPSSYYDLDLFLGITKIFLLPPFFKGQWMYPPLTASAQTQPTSQVANPRSDLRLDKAIRSRRFLHPSFPFLSRRRPHP